MQLLKLLQLDPMGAFGNESNHVSPRMSLDGIKFFVEEGEIIKKSYHRR